MSFGVGDTCDTSLLFSNSGPGRRADSYVLADRLQVSEQKQRQPMESIRLIDIDMVFRYVCRHVEARPERANWKMMCHRQKEVSDSRRVSDSCLTLADPR